jgi:acetyl-CoA C-acetyltransferase
MDDFAVIELNEAFAAQTLACFDEYPELGAREEVINAQGSGISLGHPIGCSGARIIVSIIHALKDRNLKTGLVAACLGGGEATALSVELV